MEEETVCMAGKGSGIIDGGKGKLRIRRRRRKQERMLITCFARQNVHICGKAMEDNNGGGWVEKMLHVEHFCGTTIPRI
jgi:hypothetical protein